MPPSGSPATDPPRRLQALGGVATPKEEFDAERTNLPLTRTVRRLRRTPPLPADPMRLCMCSAHLVVRRLKRCP